MSQLLFVAQSLNSDPDVYALSGSTYTDLTQDVTGGTADFLSAPQDRSGQLPVVFGYEADDYFQGFTNADGTHNLWVYDTTTQKLTDIDAANAWGSGLTPDDFIAYDGQVYFVGIDANGYDTLWTTNGTASGTFEVESNVADFGSMAAFNGLLYFNGNDGDGHDDLYAYSATTGDSVQIGPANLDPAYISPALTSTSPGAVSYDLFMSGRDSSGNVGLFVSNGSSVDELTSGNILPTDLVDMTYAVSSQNVTTDVSSVFFAGHDNGGIGLWIANTEGANEVVASSFGGHDTGLGLDPRDLTPLNGLLYFIGDDNYELNGSGLFVYNPATGSTAELLRSSDYNLEPDSATVESQQAIPATLAAYDGDLYFNGDPGDGLPDLYQYNPVTEQTTLIRVGNYDNGDGFEGGANPDDLISNGNPQTFDTGGGYVLYFSGAVGSAFSLSYTEGDWDAVYGYNGELYLNSAQTAVLGGGDWIDFASGSGNGASLYDTGGAWDSISGSNGAIYLTSAQTAVTGGDDSIEFAGGTGDALSLYSTGGAWDSVIGSNGEIYLTSAQAEVSGGGDWMDFAGGSGNALSLYGSDGDWDSVSGYNGDIYLTSAQTAVTGGADWMDFVGGSGNAVSLYGAGGDWDSVYGNDGDIYLTSAQAAVTGGGDWMDFAGGSGNAVSLYGTNGSWDTVVGYGGDVYVTGAQAAVGGGGDYIDFAGGLGNAVSLYSTGGDWDSVIGYNGEIYLTSAQAAVTGGGDWIDFAGGSGNAVSLYDAGGDWDSVSGYYGDIYLASAQASVTGGGDWIDFAGGSGNATSLYNTSGVWDTVDGSEGEIYLTSAQAAVIGGGDWMDFAGGAGNAVNLSGTQGNWDAVSGSHGTVYLTGAQAEIVGSSNAVNLTGSSYVAVSGGSEAFVFTGAFGADVVSGFASSDAIQFSKSDFASWSALQPHISQSGANTLITLDPSDTVTLTNVTATSLISTQFTFA